MLSSLHWVTVISTYWAGLRVRAMAMLCTAAISIPSVEKKTQIKTGAAVMRQLK